MIEDSQQSEGFFRQRRNFLLASTILFAFLLLDIEFSEIQIFGIKFILHNKENIIWFVFTWWAYLFWRYYQYQREVRCHAISQEYKGIVYSMTQPIIERQARKVFPEFIHPHDVNYNALQPVNWKRSSFNAKIAFPGKNSGNQEFREVTFDISRSKFIYAHVCAFLRVLFGNHHVSDHFLPYAIGVVLLTIFVLKVFVGA